METPNGTTIQRLLFQKIGALHDEKSMVATLSELLNVNKSSVYNRLNGNQMLRLDEFIMLSSHFNIPLESLVSRDFNTSSFQLDVLGKPIKNCHDYLVILLNSFKSFEHVRDLRIWFSTSELPLFYHLHFKELTLFKLFTYARINWQFEYTENLIFSPETFPERNVYEQLAIPMLNQYVQTPSVEFWTDNIYDNTLKQIQYFYKSGQIADLNVIKLLHEQLEELCLHQYGMAKLGEKWPYGMKSHFKGNHHGKIDLYFNEISPTNITLLAESNVTRGVFIVYDDPNFMFNGNEKLFDYTLTWMRKLRTKCIRISEEAELSRRSYFNNLQNKIKKSLSQY